MLHKISKALPKIRLRYVAVVLMVRSVSDRAVLKSLLNEEPSRMLALTPIPCRALLACEWWNREIQFLSTALGLTEGE